MYYSRLSELSNILSSEQIKKLDKYFANLIGGARDNITVSKIVKELSCSKEQASQALKQCHRMALLKISYGIRCPECGTFIKRVFSIEDALNATKWCYACDEKIEIGPEDIEVLYSIDNSMVFNMGQQEVEKHTISVNPVAPEDTLNSLLLADGINEYFFCTK